MIERLYVSNFRCFENFAIDFMGRPSALIIGKNGSGKSTLLQALRLFQNICRGSGAVRNLITGRDFSQQRKDVPMRFEVELVLAKKRFKYSISFELSEKSREAHIADEGLSVDGDIIFSRRQAQVDMGAALAFRLDWRVAALPVITEPPGGISVHQIRSYFASMILIAPIPAAISGFSEEDSAELQYDAGNFSSWLYALLARHPAAYGLIDEYLKSVIPDFESIQNEPRGENGKQLKVNFEEKEPSRVLRVDFKQLSDGEKCFFLSAAIVAYNKVSGPIFCMWDEPDNHLSLPEIRHFTTQLRKMTNQNGQFIATSHHPETIRSFSDENTIVFIRKSHLEPTLVRTLAELSYNGDLIEALVRGEIIG